MRGDSTLGMWSALSGHLLGSISSPGHMTSRYVFTGEDSDTLGVLVHVCLLISKFLPSRERDDDAGLYERAQKLDLKGAVEGLDFARVSPHMNFITRA